MAYTDTCPCYPLACPQGCGAEVLRKDLTDHQGVFPLEHVACPFSDISCKVKVPRQDLDKHIQSSMLQHMTDMALSHTATKTQLTALKQEHEALKKDYTTLKEDYTSLKKDNEVRMEVVGNKLLSCTPRNISTTTSQLYTLLVDTSTLKKGNTLSLALSESNTESGHHYIILEGYKFELEWEVLLGLYVISLLPLTYSERYRFNISLNNTGPETITVMDGKVLGNDVFFECGGDITAPLILHITAVPAFDI